MNLYNAIYVFFVQHIFGGFIYDFTTGEYLGYGTFSTITYDDHSTLANWTIQVGGISMNMGNYLSMLATWVTLIIILSLCCLFVYKIIKTIGGLIR